MGLKSKLLFRVVKFKYYVPEKKKLFLKFCYGKKNVNLLL